MAKRTKLFLSVVLLASIITMVGCGRKKVGEGKIVLHWSGYAYPIYDKFRAEESKKFEAEHPEVIVKYEPIASRAYI